MLSISSFSGILALAATLASAPGLAQSTAPAPAAATDAAAKAAVDVSQAWTRATPGRSTTAAVYLRIINAAKEADTLTGVETENAARAMVHTTTNTGGVARMNAMTSLAIPQASTVTLVPGGSHIMLDGLKAPLRQGESFIITLVFARAGKISATVQVLAAGATGPVPERPAAAALPAPATSPNRNQH